MWLVPGKETDAGRFAPFTPSKVLYEYDGPRTFCFFDKEQELYLAHWCDEDREIIRFLVVPFTEQLLARLEQGELTLRDALNQPRCWILEVDHDASPRACWRVSLGELPLEVLPKPGTMLLPELEPLISIRAIGELVQIGHIPGSIIKRVVDGCQKAIKVLADYASARRNQPLRLLRRLYDLPAQSLRFASFEVSFRSPLHEPALLKGLSDPEIREEKAVLESIRSMLQQGFDWLGNARLDSPSPVFGDQEASRAVLQAMRFLSPASQGPRHEVELRGTLIRASGGKVRLTREMRAAANAALQRMPRHSPELVAVTGKIRQLDADLMQFALREIEDEEVLERKCVFEEELWDDVHDVLGEEVRVRVIGTQTSPTRVIHVHFVERLSG